MVDNTLDYDDYCHGGLLHGRYIKVKGLNEGSFGIVSVAKDTLDENKLVAIKYNTGKLSDFASYLPVPKETRSVSLNSKTKSAIRTNATYSETGNSEKDVSKSVVVRETNQEVKMLQKVGKHPNITQLLETFDTYMVMEYAPRGDLHDAIHLGIAPVNTRDVINVFMQLISAVNHCHQNGVYHRDIKPENILITENWSIQLTDFGLATDNLICKDFDVGSERYMAPELLEHDDINTYHADKVDIWSLGICMLNIVFGKSPFISASSKDKMFMSFANNRETLLDIFPSMSYDLFSTMMHSLTLDPSNRDIELIKQSLSNIEVLTYDYEFEEEFKSHGIIEEKSSIDDDDSSSDKILSTLNSNDHSDQDSETSEEQNTNTIDSLLEEFDHSSVKPLPISKPNKATPKKKYEPPRRIYVDLDEVSVKKHNNNNNRKRFNFNQRRPIKVPEVTVSNDYSSNDGIDFNRKDFFTPKADFINYMERANRKKKDMKNKGNYYLSPNNQQSTFTNSSKPNCNGNVNRSMKAWKKRTRRYSHAPPRDTFKYNYNRNSNQSGRRYTNNNIKKGRQSFNRRNSSLNRRPLSSGFLKPNSGCNNGLKQHRPSSSGPKSIDGKYVPPNARCHYESVFSEDEDEDEDEDIFSFDRANNNSKSMKNTEMFGALSKNIRKLKLFDDKSSSRETSTGTTSAFESSNSSYEKYVPPHHRRHSVHLHSSGGGILKKPVLNIQGAMVHLNADKKQVKIITPVSTSAPTDSMNWFDMHNQDNVSPTNINEIDEENFKSDDNCDDYLFSIEEDASFHNELSNYTPISVGRI